jgi:hypothetical protein
MVGKVIKLEYVDSYTGQNGELFNFAVLIENDKTPYFVSVKDKDKPGISVGDDLDFTVVEYDKSEDKKQHKRASIGGKQVDLIKIKKNQPKPSFGGAGGGKGYVKTKEQELNQLLGICASYSKDLICHRTTIGNGKDHKELAKIHVEMTTDIFNGLKDLIQ